jgi:hypothetical protein
MNLLVVIACQAMFQPPDGASHGGVRFCSATARSSLLRLVFERLGRNTRGHPGTRKFDAISPSSFSFIECHIRFTKKFFDWPNPPIPTRENT